MAKHEQPKVPADGSQDDSAPISFELPIEIVAMEPEINEDASYLTPTPPAGVPIPPERSAGISIGDGGDFTTPSPGLRKRRTTQPRGFPIVSAPAEEVVIAPPPDDSPSMLMPDGVSGEDASLSLEEPTPGPEEITLTMPASSEVSPSVVLELDLLTPAPERISETPPPMYTPAPVEATPEPLRTTPRPEMLARREVTPPPVTPPPLPAETALAPEAEAMPPEGPEALPAPATPIQPMILPPPTDPAVTARAEPDGVGESEDAGAIPALPLPDVDSGANLTPLAQTLAHMAEAARLSEPGAQPDGDLSADDDVELVDSPIAQLPPETAAPPRKSVPPPPPMGATPPPIPAVRLRTPAEILSSLPVPEALSPRPRRPKRSKPWFEEVFDEDYMRTLPFISATQTAKEARFIESSLEASPGAELLDVGCGYGRHAVELCQRGYKVTGLDLSLPLLIRAADESQRRAVSVNFVHADMREMAFERQFDGAYCMLTSFGYFDEDTNLRVAEGIARALKPGGRFLLDVVNRDYIVGDLPTRIWWEGAGCVVLEEVDFNYHTSRITTRRSVVFDDGRQLEQEISIRAYGLHELGRLLRQAGFRVLDISGSFATRSQFFGSASRNLLILAEKRTDDH
ncbi:MAG: hypothetical protein QOI66_1912 [Myxococcales bacterium]|nr:hypothetical protein [Myxococcales bacterium]